MAPESAFNTEAKVSYLCTILTCSVSNDIISRVCWVFNNMQSTDLRYL